MTATRQNDEVIVDALALMRSGLNLSRTAARLGKNPSNLGKSLRAVLRDDLECCDDPIEIDEAYPTSLIIERRV